MLWLFDLLNAELVAENAHGELYLVGGADAALTEGLERSLPQNPGAI